MSNQLARIPSEGIFGGVCAGIARSAGIESVGLVRLAAIIATLVTGFVPVGIIYILAWLLMPVDNTNTTGFDELYDRYNRMRRNPPRQSHDRPQDSFRSED